MAVSGVRTVGLRGPGRGRPGHGAATPRPSRPDRTDRPTVLGAAAQRRSGSWQPDTVSLTVVTVDRDSVSVTA